MISVDPSCFLDTDGLTDDEGEDAMTPWPEAELLIGAIQPCLPEVVRELGVEQCALESAVSVIPAELLVEKGAAYFPRVQLEQPCRLVFSLTMARNAADPNVFNTQFSSLGVGVGLAHAPDPKRVERAQKVMEEALEAAGLSGLKSAEDEDE